jgi:hypothetical protein
VITAPTPTVEDDAELAAKAAMLTGAGFWSTKDGAGVRSMTLVDGPHGVRLQKAGSDHLGMNASEPSSPVSSTPSCAAISRREVHFPPKPCSASSSG